MAAETCPEPTPRPAGPDGPAPMAPPCIMVIFGAAGDLTRRLVVPALYNLVVAHRLPETFQVVGVDLAAKSTQEWRRGLSDTIHQFVTAGGGEFEADRIDPTAWRCTEGCLPPRS